MSVLNQRLKTRTPISTAVENKLFTELKELSKKTRIPLSKLLDEAISDLLTKHGVDSRGN